MPPVFPQLDQPSRDSEIVFGLVEPIGSNIALLSDELEAALSRVRYSCSLIRISKLISDVPDFVAPPPPTFDTWFDRTWHQMDSGDAIRKQFGKDVGAILSTAAIRNERTRLAPPHSGSSDAERPVSRRAYIIRSIKRPEEAVQLSRIYGASFILLGAHTARDRRIAFLAQQSSSEEGADSQHDHNGDAVKAVERDERDLSEPFGQDVQRAFPMASAFFDTSDSAQLRTQIIRFVELLFGHPYHTPRQDEHGMFLAHAARLRSSALGRQVGAAISTADGEILSIGTNEVPKGGGGFYWPDSRNDDRDHKRLLDSNDKMINELVSDFLHRLRLDGWTKPGTEKVSLSDLVRAALDDSTGSLRDARVTNLVEFGRSVHAEMAAISNAARFGIRIQDATMYVTTFPCHECARHIIASGISRVVYVDPYPKSAVKDLFSDSVAIDSVDAASETNQPRDHVLFQPYMGVAPSLYPSLYEMRKRKTDQGHTFTWDGRNSNFISPELFENVARNEKVIIQQFATRNASKIGKGDT